MSNKHPSIYWHCSLFLKYLWLTKLKKHHEIVNLTRVCMETPFKTYEGNILTQTNGSPIGKSFSGCTCGVFVANFKKKVILHNLWCMLYTTSVYCLVSLIACLFLLFKQWWISFFERPQSFFTQLFLSQTCNNSTKKFWFLFSRSQTQ